VRSPSTTTIKRHPSDVKLSYTYQFQPVHSVGVIIAWLCFTFITVEILDPNLILRFAFAPPISIPVTVGFCRLLWFYVKCLKRRIIGKNVFFELCILEMVWEIFFKFEMWLLLKRGHLHSKFGAIQIRNYRTTYTCVKIVSLFLVNVLTVLLPHHFLGLHDTPLCVLIFPTW